MRTSRISGSLNSGIGLLSVIIFLGPTLQGCQQSRHMVLASTATNIGVEISQNPATQSPQAKLGYQRAELAIVPSNRTTTNDVTDINSKGGGATDVADVVMELRYGGIFDFGPSSGIYQRLAVGSIAVKQPGASMMFSKDTDGTVTKDAADALKSLTSVKAWSWEVRISVKCLSDLRKNDAALKVKIDDAVKSVTAMTWDAFVDNPPPDEQLKQLMNKLNGQGVHC